MSSEEKKSMVKTKHRSEEEKKKLIIRLNRIEGQVRGIKGMIEKNAYCADVLVQVTSVTAALNSFGKELLSEHMRTCVVNDIRDGNNEVVDELVDLMYRLVK